MENAPAPSLPHAWQAEANEADGAEQFGFKRRLPLLIRKGFECSHRWTARIVNEDVDALKRLQCFRHQGFDIFSPAHIGGKGAHPPPGPLLNLLCRLEQRLLMTSGDHDLRSLSSECQSACSTKPFTCGCDQRHFSV
jgi:hypothetical protein